MRSLSVPSKYNRVVLSQLRLMRTKRVLPSVACDNRRTHMDGNVDPRIGSSGRAYRIQRDEQCFSIRMRKTT